MTIEIIKKLDEIEAIFKGDKELFELKKLKGKIENDKELINKIETIKTMDKYDDNYLSLKKEILNNRDYKRFNELENDLYLLIQNINIKLNSLREKSGCR